MITGDSGSQPATGLSSDTASWHALDAAEVMRQLDATCAGLGSAAAEARRQRFGENALPTAPPPSIWVRLLRQLADPLVGALLVAAAVASAVAVVEGASEDSLLVRFSDAIAIVTIVLLNTALGLAQEQRAGKALEALRKLSTGTARVLRDGHWQSLPLTVLVPGDIVALEAGDAVPADLRVLEAHEFATVEASLTGEARPTTKTTTPQTEGAPLAERRNLLFLGTHIARGTGRGVVVETGARTALGRIGALVADEAQPKTPLELRLAHFGRVILLVCIVVAAGLFALGITIGEHPWPMLLLTAVSLAVAAIPEGLPAITTITLALGMERMATRGAIVRKLPAVETLGSATIICSDKTGTLTENAMNVQRLFTGDGHYRLRGTGYEPEGTLLDESGVKLAVLPPALQRLLECGALCGTTHLMRGDDGLRHVVGDPTEAALVVAAERGGVDVDGLRHSAAVEVSEPFDSARKRMAVRAAGLEGDVFVHTKGSLEVILPLCSHVLFDDHEVPLDEGTRARFLASGATFSREGLRVLALAQRREDSESTTGFSLLGLVAMEDPPREGAEASIEACHRAGIRVAMITGDHKETGVAIARRLGLWHDDALALTGEEIDRVGEPGGPSLERVAVFARASPEQKLRIVRALQAQGHVVAMTGDGVNDAPALRAADIGVAMGRSGTDVAREAADMVLADDNFATIVTAVREGRSLFHNIQRFIFFLNAVNAGLVVAVIGTFLLPGVLPLTPLMILWINLVTNGLPALALGIEPPDERHMRERPRPRRAGIWERHDGIGIGVVGTTMGGLALLLLAEVFALPSSTAAQGRTLAFCLLALSPLVVAFGCRSATGALVDKGLFGNPFLGGAVLVSAALQLATIVLSPLRQIFGTAAVSPIEAAVLAALCLLPLVVLELFKAGLRLSQRPFTSRGR